MSEKNLESSSQDPQKNIPQENNTIEDIINSITVNNEDRSRYQSLLLDNARMP
jgi:hypothetical protein